MELNHHETKEVREIAGLPPVDPEKKAMADSIFKDVFSRSWGAVIDEQRKEKEETEEGDYLSTYKERIDRTPNESGERGQWEDVRGESTFYPSNSLMKSLLKEFGLEGIQYTHGIPDFLKCSACTVEIDNMTEKRHGIEGNFAQCDQKCADMWNKDGQDGKDDWTARDVQKWREENGYSWHERNDMKTCDLIPTKVNDYFGHLGGVAECKRRDGVQTDGGEFDE